MGREAAVHERTRPEEMTKKRTAVWSAIGSLLSPYATHHRLRVVDLVPDLAGAISAERDAEQRSKCSGVFALRVAELNAHHVVRALSNDFSVALPYRHGDEYDHIACPADMIHGKVVAWASRPMRRPTPSATSCRRPTSCRSTSCPARRRACAS